MTNSGGLTSLRPSGMGLIVLVQEVYTEVERGKYLELEKAGSTVFVIVPLPHCIEASSEGVQTELDPVHL